MVCAPVRSLIPSLKLEDYLSVQAHKPCSIYHIFTTVTWSEALYHVESTNHTRRGALSVMRTKILKHSRDMI